MSFWCIQYSKWHEETWQRFSQGVGVSFSHPWKSSVYDFMGLLAPLAERNNTPASDTIQISWFIILRFSLKVQQVSFIKKWFFIIIAKLRLWEKWLLWSRLLFLTPFAGIGRFPLNHNGDKLTTSHANSAHLWACPTKTPKNNTTIEKK